MTDNAGGRFHICSRTVVVTVANASLLNYESNTSHSITVQASDGSLTSSQSFTIAVTDVAPTTPTDNSAPTGGSVSEGASNGDAVGITALSTDIHGRSVARRVGDDGRGRCTMA